MLIPPLHRWSALFFALLFFAGPTSALAGRLHSISNHLQTGFEYDTNVFKAFGSTEGDMLLRALLKSRGTYTPTDLFDLGWIYQGGGKKFFDHGAQDLIIQYIQVPLTFRLHPKLRVRLEPDFKFQNESNSLDANALDINEDYFSTATRLTAYWTLPARFSVEPFGEFTYFNFNPTDTFSFFRERGGFTIKRGFLTNVLLGLQYTFGRQQFEGRTRQDQTHQVSTFVQFTSLPFASVRYTFQDNNSNDGRYAFTNHRVSVLVSHSFGKERPIWAVHLMGTLQVKGFPAVYEVTEEGQRYLLTGAEDENFNSILVKVSYHPIKPLALEAKYTRYADDLSGQQNPFSRSLVYLGARYLF